MNIINGLESVIINDIGLGGSPGKVVLEGDSCSEGCGFEPLCHLLD